MTKAKVLNLVYGHNLSVKRCWNLNQLHHLVDSLDPGCSWV